MKSDKKSKTETSWESVEKWYHGLVGEEGHYYHRQVVMPGVSKLLEKPSALLDLACGNGVLSGYLSNEVTYHGVDSSSSLIKAAKRRDTNPIHTYAVGDITHPLKLTFHEFSHATLILAVQNIEHPKAVFQNVYRHLCPNGKFLIVLNHPCFRIPRQSGWGVDAQRKIQYRRMDRYLSPLKIPIYTHPSKGESSTHTLSFHYPLSAYCQWLYETGFAVELLEEWTSDKKSTGKAAVMENRSREEFPLFLALRAIKRS